MTKADWIALVGFLSLAGGLGMIYKPLAVIFLGIVLLRIAFTLKPAKSGEPE